MCVWVGVGVARKEYNIFIITIYTTARSVVSWIAVTPPLAGMRVAVVNAASAYHVGGGFLTGGRHALEVTAPTSQNPQTINLRQVIDIGKWEFSWNLSFVKGYWLYSVSNLM